MNAGMEFAHKFARAYAAACKPLCRELKLPQTAFDILMFLPTTPATGRRATSWSCPAHQGQPRLGEC